MHPAYDATLGRLPSLAFAPPLFISLVALALPRLVVTVSIVSLAVFLALLVGSVVLLLFHSTLHWTR
jgi:hypothetical protein